MLPDSFLSPPSLNAGNSYQCFFSHKKYLLLYFGGCQTEVHSAIICVPSFDVCLECHLCLVVRCGTLIIFLPLLSEFSQYPFQLLLFWILLVPLNIPLIPGLFSLLFVTANWHFSNFHPWAVYQFWATIFHLTFCHGISINYAMAKVKHFFSFFQKMLHFRKYLRVYPRPMWNTLRTPDSDTKQSHRPIRYWYAHPGAL